MPFDKQFSIGCLSGCVLRPGYKIPGSPNVVGKAILNRNDMLIASPGSKDIVQHELQHLFDNLNLIDGDSIEKEYRAALASIVFSENLSMAYQRIYYSYFVEALKKETLISEPPGKPHYEARRKIVCEIERTLFQEVGLKTFKARINREERHLPEEVRTTALKLLNEAYKKKAGLTYDEILEPFKKE